MGNIDEEAVKPAILQYLGSIQGKYARNTYVELPMDIAKGTSETVFQREMQNPKASVFNIFSGHSEFTLKNNITMSMFRQIMDIVYTEKIREEEGGIYGVTTSGSITRDGDRHTRYLGTLNIINPKDIQDFARQLLAQKNETTVIMLPATTEKN